MPRSRRHRRVHPLVEVDLVARVEEDAEERVAEVSVDDLVERASGLADVQRAVPLGHRLEVRGDQPLHVVADPRRQLRRIFDDESGAAVQRAPDAERDREAVAAFDPTVARAEQSERCPVPARQHQVAGERHAVPPEQRDGVVLAHPGPESEEQLTDAVRGPARRVLERGELLHLVDHAESVGGADQQMSGVLDRADRGHPAQLVDDERRHLDRLAVGVHLPADHPDPVAIPDAFCGEDLGQRLGAISRLAGEAEVLEEDGAAWRAAPLRPCRSTRCRPGWPARRRCRRRASPPRSGGRSR